MASTQFKTPKATRELPNNVTIDNNAASNFVRKASVRTSTYEDGVTRKMLSTQVSVELLNAMDIISKHTRVNKRILYEEAIAAFVEKHKDIL